MPWRSSRSAVLGPIPGSRPGAEPAKRSRACAALSTTKPSGFSASEATFATSLLGPIPIEQPRPVACVTARLHAQRRGARTVEPLRSR